MAVCNVKGYSTHSVAQLTVLMALTLTEKLGAYTAAVTSGEYQKSGVANKLSPIYHELCGKTWGIVGAGAIGTQVARVAEAVLSGKLGGFACDVYSTEPFGDAHPFAHLVGLDNVLLTPHMAWGALEARVRCLDEVAKNIEAFFGGEIRCRVDL